jgi:DNA invertase Pin-like site-specific DNA recombinase
MKSIGIYARVSTGMQDSDVQISALKEYASRRGFDIAGIYNDVGISGSRATRPELDRLMSDARRRKLDAVLVFKFDRFARSTMHLLRALEEFGSLGVDFISYSEGIDTSTPVGKMVFTMVAAIAEFERDLIRERVAAGVQRAREKGKRLGRPRAKVDLDSIKALRAEGKSIRQIAGELGCSKSVVAERLKQGVQGVRKASVNPPEG